MNRQGIANLLSIPQLEEDGYVIDYNTNRDWVVITPSGKRIVFQRDTGLCNRMPYIDMREHQDGIDMVNTVRKNFEGFTRKQVEKAVLAREVQAMVAVPTEAEFKKMVSSKSLSDCPVTVDDVANARAIFGPDRAGLRGKTVRQKPDRVEPEYTRIPRDFYELQKFVKLTADVMIVNGLPFLTTLSRNIRFGTVRIHICISSVKRQANLPAS